MFYLLNLNYYILVRIEYFVTLKCEWGSKSRSLKLFQEEKFDYLFNIQ
jgi:hypothetical protein